MKRFIVVYNLFGVNSVPYRRDELDSSIVDDNNKTIPLFYKKRIILFIL
jgi:hypothetical protein